MFKFILIAIRTYVEEDESLKRRKYLIRPSFVKALMKQVLAHERACTAAQKRGQVLHLFKDRTEEGDGDRVPICEKMCEEFGWNDLLVFTPALPCVTGTVHFSERPVVALHVPRYTGTARAASWLDVPVYHGSRQ